MPLGSWRVRLDVRSRAGEKELNTERICQRANSYFMTRLVFTSLLGELLPGFFRFNLIFLRLRARNNYANATF